MKIGDFGLVTAVEENCEDDGYNLQAIQSSRHTNQVGTKLYMSPEQVGTLIISTFPTFVISKDIIVLYKIIHCNRWHNLKSWGPS